MIISNKKRINSLSSIKKLFEVDYKIGIKITSNELEKLGIKEFNEGYSFEPNPMIGVFCKRNITGISYTDKTKSKEYRYICTHEYNVKDWQGNEHTGYTDLYRYVYPKTEISPYNIEFMFSCDSEYSKYIIANLDSKTDEDKIKFAINMFLEIFGFCEIFDEKFKLKSCKNIKRCNWEILPKGIKDDYIKLRLQDMNKNKKRISSYEEYRRKYMESLNYNEIYEGSNGFTGYYAYVLNKYCYLESFFYGNATYIVDKSNWEELSKLCKKDLLNSNKLIEKITHNEHWEYNMNRFIKQYENLKDK